MVYLIIILGVAQFWILSNLFALFSNYRLARNCGLPIVITPANPDNLIWMIFNQLIRPYLKAILPDAVWYYFSIL